jgi:hypothetical protein
MPNAQIPVLSLIMQAPSILPYHIPEIHSSALRVQIRNKISDRLKVSGFHHTGVVISCRKRLPYLRGRLAELEEAAHMAWSIFFMSAVSSLLSLRMNGIEQRVVVRLDSKVGVIRSQKGLIFCGWNIGSSFMWGIIGRKEGHTVLSRLSNQRGRGWGLR